MTTKLPAIPVFDGTNTAEVVGALKEAMEVRVGQRGDALDAGVTFRDLEALGFVEPVTDGTAATGLSARAGVRSVFGEGVPDLYDPAADLTPPPSPTELKATAVFDTVFLSWSMSAFPNQSYWEIHRAFSNDLSAAALIGTSTSQFFTDIVGEDRTVYYWVRTVSAAGIKSAWNSSFGTAVTTGIDPAKLIKALEGEILESALSQDLATKIEVSFDQARATVRRLTQEVNDRITAVNNEATTRASAIQTEAATRASQIQAETTARVLAIQDEATARAAAIQAEVDARTAAVQAEAAARANALLQEAQDRQAAITAETVIRQTADESLAAQITTVSAAVDDAAAAIQAETTARANADSTEATLRETLATQMRGNYTGTDVAQVTTGLIFSERTARTTADSALTSSISTLNATVTNNYNTLNTLIQNESTARATAVSAEAAERNLLSAQLRGNYTGSDLSQLTSGLLYQERIARAAQDSSLAQQITLLSAGAGEQFDWKAIWYFDDGVEGWTGNGTPTVTAGYLRPANQASSAHVISPTGIGASGDNYGQLRLRIRKVGNPTFAGYVWWRATTDTTWDTARRFTLTAPTFDANGIGLIIANPGWAVTVDRIRLDLSSAQTATDYFEIDWVAVGRPAPGASSAQLAEEEQARASADAAEVTARQTLSTSLIGQADPNGVTLANMTSGLLYNERVARSTADSALSSDITALTSTVTTNYSTLNSAILSEQTTRANADTALTTSINNLSATVTSNYNTLNSAIINEQNARASGDSAEATARNALATQMRGNYAGTDLAQLTSGLLYSERVSRSTADGALASDISALSATVTNNYNTLNAAITAEQTARATGDTAETTARNTLATQIRGGYTGTDITQLSTGLLYNERVARSTADQTITESVSLLSATVTDNFNTLSADILDEASSRASGDSAEASARSALSTQLRGNYTGTDVAQLTQGLIYSERQARSEADSTIVETVSALSAVVNTKNKTYSQATAPTTGMVTGDLWFNTGDNNKAHRWNGTSWVPTQDLRIAQNAADILTEQQARASGDSAEASARNTLSAQIRGGYTGTDVNQLTAGLIFSEKTARVNADGALSEQIDTLSTTVGDNTTSIQTAQQSIDGVQAKYSVKIDNNGHVSGFGLISTNNNGSPTSAFIIRADKFAVVDPASTANNLTNTPSADAVPFFIEGGVTYIKNAMIKDASITDAKIGSLAAKKITAGYIGASIAMDAAQVYGASLYAGGTTSKTYDAQGYVTSFTANNPTFKVEGGNVDIVAPNFRIRSVAAGGSLFTPFKVEGGIVYIDTARIKDGDITTAQIQNATIQSAQITSLEATKIVPGPNGLTIDANLITLDENVTLDTYYDSSIGRSRLRIKDLGVKTAKIDDLAVTTGKIGNLAVDTLKIAGNAVTQPQVYTAADVFVNSAINNTSSGVTVNYNYVGPSQGDYALEYYFEWNNGEPITYENWVYKGANQGDHVRVVTYSEPTFTGAITAFETPVVTVGVDNLAAVQIVYYATFDGKDFKDSGQHIFMLLDTGVGYRLVAQTVVGTRTSGGDTYAAMSVAMTYTAKDISTARVKILTGTRAVHLAAGTGSQSSYLRNNTISFLGAKR